MGAEDDLIIRALKITSCCASGRAILGTDVTVITSRFTIAVANLAFLDEIILADGSALVIVKAIAARGTAPVTMGAA